MGALDENQARFLKETVEKGLRDILDAQIMIASKNIYQEGHARIQHKRAGATLQERGSTLVNELTKASRSVTLQGSGIATSTVFPLYMRFLDMKEHGNWRIYNRQVWGILYSETLHTVKYEYRDWLRNQINTMFNKNNQK